MPIRLLSSRWFPPFVMAVPMVAIGVALNDRVGVVAAGIAAAGALLGHQHWRLCNVERALRSHAVLGPMLEREERS